MRYMQSRKQVENIAKAEAQAEAGKVLPANPATVEGKTYVLQLVNGVLVWTEVE